MFFDLFSKLGISLRVSSKQLRADVPRQMCTEQRTEWEAFSTQAILNLDSQL